MPVFPKQTLTYPDGGRVHLDKTYERFGSLHGDARLQFEAPESFEKEEQQWRALYLRTLSRMLAESENGRDVNAEHLYANPVGRHYSFGSQPHLIRIDGEAMVEEYGSKRLHLGGNETTTKYQSHYNFIEKYFDRPPHQKVHYSVHAWDTHAIDMLEKKGVPHEAVEKLGRQFLALADIADHDYLHQLVNHRHDLVNSEVITFAPSGRDAPMVVTHKKIGMTTGSTREDLTLSLHAQILHRMFEESPGRKAHVLTYAARAFEQLGDMQQQALSNCAGDKERLEVNEAVTYFAELTAHRLFRIFSPDEAALREQTTATGKSVAEAAGALTLITPNRLLLQHQGEKPPTGLAQLEMNCSEHLGETYRAIHSIDSFPVEIKQSLAGYMPGIIEPTALEALALFSKAAAMHMPDPTGYLEASGDAAGRVRTAQSLRAGGNRLEALRIEAELRDGPAAKDKPISR